jgi:hypothetical protein
MSGPGGHGADGHLYRRDATIHHSCNSYGSFTILQTDYPLPCPACCAWHTRSVLAAFGQVKMPESAHAPLHSQHRPFMSVAPSPAPSSTEGARNCLEYEEESGHGRCKWSSTC